MTSIVVIIGIFVAFVAFRVIDNKMHRSVTRHESFADIFFCAVQPWMLHGYNGTRAVIFHPASGTMVQAIKSLKPSVPWGEVQIRVVRTRVPNSLSCNFKGGWKISPVRGDTYLIMPSRRLPSPYSSEIVEEVKCGASLKKAGEVIEHMLCEIFNNGKDSSHYVWCEKGGSKFVLGVFEDQ